jgi:hypothetical protein
MRPMPHQLLDTEEEKEHTRYWQGTTSGLACLMTYDALSRTATPVDASNPGEMAYKGS